MVILFYPTLTGRRNALSKESPKRNIQKEKIETDKRRKHFFHTFLYLLGEWTNQRYVPRHQTAKWCCWFDGHCLTRLGSQKTWVFISLHRLQIRHSKILQILARPLPIGYFTFYYFSFFLIFNRMDAWSLMRGDAFIHFVCGSRRVNIRLGVLLLIPKSPQITLYRCYPHFFGISFHVNLYSISWKLKHDKTITKPTGTMLELWSQFNFCDSHCHLTFFFPSG